MRSCPELEVEVNGQATFMVDKKTIASFSGKLSRMFAKVSSRKKNLKVIFHEFPGGAQGFELLARYCYNNGRIDITPCNVILLNSAAHFLEIDLHGNPSNLLHQPILFWSWSHLLLALKHSQHFVTSTTTTSVLLQTILDCLVQRLLFPHTSSSDMSSSRWSYDDARSSIATPKDSCSQTTTTTWWFDDLLFFNIDLVDKVIRELVCHNVDHVTISKFLFYYRKSRFVDAGTAEKRLITETLIDLLSLLHNNSVSCKGLFDLLRVASCLRVSKLYANKLECLIGSKLDQATIDHLLVPSPPGKGYAYDVNLVLRLVRTFLQEREHCSLKVVWLVDTYIAQVAPDLHLGSSKFAALLTLLPDSSRDSHDMLYQAIDMYFEVHTRLCEVKRLFVCSALNYEKLSTSTMKHMSRNSKFPSRSVVKALVAQQMKLKSSIQEACNLKTSNDPLPFPDGRNTNEKCGKKIYLSSDTDKFKARLQGMQWRVMELEKLSRLLQTHMVKTSNRSVLPKLCSS